MKVLITGCNGQVGRCLVKQLKALKNTEVLAVDLSELDITDSSVVDKKVFTFQPDVIINAAAHTAVDKAEDEIELSYAINSDGPHYLAEAAERIGAVILHISTDYVFDGDKDGLYSETDQVNPQGIYGLSKLAGEDAVAKACPRHIILRTAWVFSEHGNNFVKTMLRLAKTRDILCVVGDQFGGPTFAGDIADALISIAINITDQGADFDTHKYGVYHFSGMPHVSWSEFANTIFNKAVEQGELEKSPQVKSITTQEYPTPAKRPANSKLSTQKIDDLFGIVASDWQNALNNLSAYKTKG